MTAYLLAKDPKAAVNSPRNIVIGHVIGVAAGLGSAGAFGVLGEPSALTGTFVLGHALGSALAIVLTVSLTEGLRCPHPPAAATTLVASLGLLSLQGGVLAFMAGVAVLAGCSFALRRSRPSASPPKK
ncbi:hypothetical protein DB30_04519 [Enhygromyxa salina]|uniref:HPP transmembrane region domain-containing protein n=1 Tax=Enhygromyxa salina TaxID=215803 RepID=A0A0C2D8Q6_9BACT|nr:hypothetical protein DB30_04519 [Enhygromyxa salina]